MIQDRHAVTLKAGHGLRHIPGDDGWPIIGNALRMLRDPVGSVGTMYRKYGPVYRTYAFGVRRVILLGPEANELALLDRDKNFVSSGGWKPGFRRAFPRGRLFIDLDESRLQRKVLGVAFKPEPLKAYLVAINNGVSQRIAQFYADDRLKDQERPDLRPYPAINEPLSLDHEREILKRFGNMFAPTILFVLERAMPMALGHGFTVSTAMIAHGAA